MSNALNWFNALSSLVASTRAVIGGGKVLKHVKQECAIVGDWFQNVRKLEHPWI